MELWLKVFEVILPVILVVLTGYLFGRITKVNLKSINLFIMYISTPCLIFSSLTEGKVTFNDAYTIVLVGSILVLISILLSFSLVRATKRDPSVYLNPIVFPNTANLGLPIVLFAFGARAFDYAIMFTTVIFFLQCTIGIFIINGATKIKEAFKSPLVYAVILPILFNKTGIEIDAGVSSSIKLLGTTCIPLMMFSLGHKLSETKILDFREDLMVGALRIAIGIALSLLICKLLKIDNFLAQVMIVQYSMPAAVFNFILADRYNQSPEKVASIVFASTIISIPVIPIILYCLMQ